MMRGILVVIEVDGDGVTRRVDWVAVVGDHAEGARVIEEARENKPWASFHIIAIDREALPA